MQCDGCVSVGDIDKSIRNKFVWAWIDKKDESGEFFLDYVRKLTEPGMLEWRTVFLARKE